MRRMAKWLVLAVALGLLGCESRQPGTCEKDSHCEGVQICFEKKCMTVKQRDEILEQRREVAKPKVCQDKDGDGVRAGNGCPPSETHDCNDESPEMAPGREEICDEIDNDCDGMINEGLKGCVQTIFGGAAWGNQEKNRLDAPRGIIFDPAGFIVVSDNHHLWRVYLDGRAELLAGSVVSHAQDGVSPIPRAWPGPPTAASTWRTARTTVSGKCLPPVRFPRWPGCARRSPSTPAASPTGRPARRVSTARRIWP